MQRNTASQNLLKRTEKRLQRKTANQNLLKKSIYSFSIGAQDAPVDLTTLSSLRASDAQNCGKMRISELAD